MLNIALPKGRLGDQVYELLASVGYDCKSIYDENRKLVFENPQTGVRYLLVKPSDVAIYVEHHAADVGIVGKDILMESNPDVYELLDLRSEEHTSELQSRENELVCRLLLEKKKAHS